jgi:hypothetical protein
MWLTFQAAMFHMTFKINPVNFSEQLVELARRASPMDGTSNPLGRASQKLTRLLRVFL